MNRQQFLDYAKEVLKDLTGPVEHVLFSYEDHIKRQSQYFLVTHCVKMNDDFWAWCKRSLSENPICYYSNEKENAEWWGFANEKDAFIWSTRWL